MALTRKVGEVVTIGKLTIKIIRVKGYSEVVLGIDAPRDIRIWRGERFAPDVDARLPEGDNVAN